MTGHLLAHGGADGSGLMATLNLLALAGAVAAGYETGVRRLLGAAPSSSWTWRRIAFHVGLLLLVVALLPAFESVTDASFPAHMAQHMLVLLVAAPLLALGAPGLPLLLALPAHWRRRVTAVRSSPPARRLRSLAVVPALAVATHTAVVWGWHLPVVYTAALTSPTLHVIEHLCYLAAGWWFWSLLCTPGRHRLAGGAAVLYVFLAALPMSALGAVLTLAPQPLYPAQTGTGPGALADQQLAGLVMWIPPDVVYLTLCASLVLVWLRRLDRSTPGSAPLPPSVLPASTESKAGAR
jgi:putative membrane protein